MFNVTGQRLVNQENNILKRKWLSDLELEEIQKNIEDIGHGKVRLESVEDEEKLLKCVMCYRKRQEKDSHHRGKSKSIEYWRPLEK